jgi:preprotein translocase subunit SecA
MSVVKKYSKTIQEINRFDFSERDDSDLSDSIGRLRAELSGGRSPDDALPEVFAIIREVIDRRLGIWKLFGEDNGKGSLGVAIERAYAAVEEKRKSVDDSEIHLDASFYSTVREMRRPGDGLTFWPYDVQLMGALALYDGKIAEMGTGEGKTVVAVFPACIWALSGEKVHIATVNDYLAHRDCVWMGPVFRFLGLNVDCILSHMPNSERKQAYKADIVYGSNYEFGFDYLWDNLGHELESRAQNKLEYVIIDEIDSILMDEATTPLIISGASEDRPGEYWNLKPVVELLLEKQGELVARLFHEAKMERDSQRKIIKLIQTAKADPWNSELLDYLSHNRDIIKRMRTVQSGFAAARSEYKLEEDMFYVVDEKLRTVNLTDRGMTLVEEQLGKGFMTPPAKSPLTPLYKRGEASCPSPSSEGIRNFLQLLRAYVLYRKDEDYVVHDGGVIIVDEFTGRLAFGKKYEEGLHQAIECKEGLEITSENRVVGRITHPNYFRLYDRMVGMTATAHTEAEEFRRLYNLEVVSIPTNKPVIRVDLSDRFYRTEAEKLESIIDDIDEHHNSGRPVLVGTRSVEKSERLSALLDQRGIPHNVLNAKNHAQEAEIVKSAGQPYAVTIATNMAGRGTDIVLGDPRLGLHVIGSERHGARRIDDQLRGRSGRQGDPGSSRFYMSLQDDLFRIFGQEEMTATVKAFDRSRTHDLSRLTRQAQRKSEEMSYHIRRHLVERDDIADRQRKIIYGMRWDVLAGDWTKGRVKSLIADVIRDQGGGHSPEQLKEYCMSTFGVRIPKPDVEMPSEEVERSVVEAFEQTYDRRERVLGADFSQRLGKAVMLEVLETAWADYLSFQSEFDRSHSLRSYVRGDALTDYRIESSRLFDDLLASIRREALRDIFTYPLPGEKIDSIHRTENTEKISEQVRELLSIS